MGTGGNNGGNNNGNNGGNNGNSGWNGASGGVMGTGDNGGNNGGDMWNGASGGVFGGGNGGNGGNGANSYMLSGSESGPVVADHGATNNYGPGPGQWKPMFDEVCSRSMSESELEIVFLIDISSSIAPNAELGMGGLWKWVRALMKGFDFQSGVKMSLATFSSTGEVYSRLGSYSQGQVDNALNGLISNLQATAESNLNHGLKTARKEFRSYGSDDSDKAIILITDGWSTSDNTPFYHANLAVKEGKLLQ